MQKIEIPNQEEPITLTQEEYPDLPFKEFEIRNPRKLLEGFDRYYAYMAEKYRRGELNLKESHKKADEK